MTPPRPTAPTAAEQAFSHAVYDVLAQIGHGDRTPATSFLDDINRLAATLMAAVRAEAMEDAATLAEIYVGLSARAARVPRAIRALVSK